MQVCVVIRRLPGQTSPGRMCIRSGLMFSITADFPPAASCVTWSDSFPTTMQVAWLNSSSSDGFGMRQSVRVG